MSGWYEYPIPGPHVYACMECELAGSVDDARWHDRLTGHTSVALDKATSDLLRDEHDVLIGARLTAFFDGRRKAAEDATAETNVPEPPEGT